MIPILYRSAETTFQSNGIGQLADCVSCVVTEERNGIYELEMQYPVTGKYYQTMKDSGGIIGAFHDDAHDVQPFDIYKISTPIDGIATINARHISYRLSNIIVMPFVADSCAEAISDLKTQSANANPFTFWTDKTVSSRFTLKTPRSCRSLLAGSEGSLLDVYGKGEYKFDKWNVRLYVNRGVDSGVTIRYKKNLSGYNEENSSDGTFTAIAPYWIGSEGDVAYLPEGYVVAASAPTFSAPWTDENGTSIKDGNGTAIYFNYADVRPAAVDFSSDFESMPTAAQLRTRALQYLANNEPWIPTDNVKVDFIQMWQTEDYKNVAALQRVSLCDTVSVYFPELNVVKQKQKVIRVEYDVLLERYNSMELGKPTQTLGEAISASLAPIIKQKADVSFMRDSIAAATEAITGGLGGYVMFTYDANGQPQEILIMDSPDKTTAVNVIRMNKAGIGFSQNGYMGPFNSAWTIDGTLDMQQINVVNLSANLITAGTMLADRIKGGTLTLGGNNNADGLMQVLDAGGTVVVQADNTGVQILKGSINIGSGNFTVDDTGNVSILKGSINIGSGEFVVNASGEVTAKSLTCDDYIYVDGGTGSLLRIPLRNSLGAGAFVELSDKGFMLDNKYTGQILIFGNPLSGGQLDTWSELSIERPGYAKAKLTHNSFSIYDQNSSHYIVQFTDNGSSCYSNFSVGGNLTVSGTKNRAVDAGQYGDRLLYCYETASPMFGDIGEGEIGDDGIAYIWLDPVFAQAISAEGYQVFLQKYGEGDCWVSERKGGCFVVRGTPGLSFGWELKAKQADFDQRRLEKFDKEETV